MKKIKFFIVFLVAINILILGLVFQNEVLLYKELSKMHINVQELLDRKASIDLPNSSKIIETNLLVKNKTWPGAGAGSHIKIGNQSYLLTCAHIVREENDVIIAITDKGKALDLSLFKISKGLDLALFEINTKYGGAYLEISSSQNIPREGSRVIAIGNPMGYRNVITEGIIAKTRGSQYLLTNTIYFGNSGGALIYKGKIVGVVVQLTFNNHNGVPQHYGVAVNYNGLKTFLKDIYE